MTSGEPIIRAHNLGRRFGPRWIVKDFTLELSAGEIVGLVGPDGAGKTTLLQLCAAILDPSEGSCEVLGCDTVKQAPHVTSRIGYMAQGFCLYDRLTVAENLKFAAKMRGVTDLAFLERRTRLLKMAGLSPFLDRREGALSGDMRKKLALCTNLVHDLPLLLLDEPGLGVDPLSRRELWRMLGQFRRQGCAIMLSTSYTDEAERCDRVAFLDEGRIIALGAPGALRSSARGQVFAVRAAEPASVESALEGAPGVLGIQWRAEEIRIVTDSADEPLLEHSDCLAGLGRPEPVEPSMEVVFTVLAFIKRERIAALTARGA